MSQSFSTCPTPAALRVQGSKPVSVPALVLDIQILDSELGS